MLHNVNLVHKKLLFKKIWIEYLFLHKIKNDIFRAKKFQYCLLCNKKYNWDLE